MRHQHDRAALRRQAAKQREELDLVPHVEPRRRLVEHDRRPVLRQRARDAHPLLLAAAQRREGPLGERERIHVLQRVPYQPAILVDSARHGPRCG